MALVLYIGRAICSADGVFSTQKNMCNLGLTSTYFHSRYMLWIKTAIITWSTNISNICWPRWRYTTHMICNCYANERKVRITMQNLFKWKELATSLWIYQRFRNSASLHYVLMALSTTLKQNLFNLKLKTTCWLLSLQLIKAAEYVSNEGIWKMTRARIEVK